MADEKEHPSVVGGDAAKKKREAIEARREAARKGSR
jgi:hypothetical protein